MADPSLQRIKEIMGSVNVTRSGDEITFSYGAFLSSVAQVLMHCNQNYEEPTTAVILVELMRIFPAQHRHIITAVATEAVAIEPRP